MIKAKYYTTTEIVLWSFLIAFLSWLLLYDNLVMIGFIFGGSYWWLNDNYHISKKPVDKNV
jgi:hypothetical protein